MTARIVRILEDRRITWRSVLLVRGYPSVISRPLSDDTFGDQLHDFLRKEGVDLPIERRSPWPTSLALVTIDMNGMPAYRLYREGIADKDTSFEEIAASLPLDLRVFHTGSLAITHPANCQESAGSSSRCKRRASSSAWISTSVCEPVLIPKLISKV